MPDLTIPPPEKLLDKISIPPPEKLLGQSSVPDIKKAYLDATEGKKISKVWSDKPEPEENMYTALARGSDRLGSMLAKTPAMIYDLAAQATDALVNTGSKAINAIAGTDLKTDYQTTSEGLAKELGIENKVAKYYDDRVKKSQEIAAQKYDKGITDYFTSGNTGDLKKGFGLLANSIAESAPTTIALLLGNAAGVSTAASTIGGGLVFAADKKAELDEQAPHMDRNTKNEIALANGLFEGFFEQYGITKLASVTKNILLKDGKEAALKVAEEGFKDVYKPVAKKYLGAAAEESISEAATQFAQNAVDKYSGYKPDLDLMQGVVDAGIVGLGAGVGASSVPALIETNQAKKANTEAKTIQQEKVAKDFERGKHAFEIMQKGEEAVRQFKDNVTNEVNSGNLTEEEGAHAITRVNAYKEYNDIVGALELNDKLKLEVFDKTYRKQELESQLSQMGEKNKLHPLKQAEYSIKEKFANDLQKDIDAIVLNAAIKEETTVANKTVNDLAKKEQKEIKEAEPVKPGEKKLKPTDLQKLMGDKYKSKITEDTRSYEEVPVAEYNSSEINNRLKHKKTSEWLDRQPEKTAYGVIAQRPFIDDKGNVNSVLGIELEGGKKLRFSSSMERAEGHNGHFLIERFNNEVPKGTPIGIKVENIPSFEDDSRDRKAIKAFRADNGKFIGWMKETTRGTSDYSPAQQNELAHLETIIEPTATNGVIKTDIPNPISTEKIKTKIVTPKKEPVTKDKTTKSKIEAKDINTPLFQKKSSASNENIAKVIDTVQKNFPKVKVGYDTEIVDKKGNPVAGRLKGNTLSINPFYAGEDTPIHEAAHILLDAIGENKVVQKAVEQLKNTPLWDEIKERYSELNDKQLANEVLAEAIGREGKGIFEKVEDQNKFIQYLNYIFDWLKQKLGLDKNIAKSLARQIISGIKTKDLDGKEGEEKFSKINKKDFNYFREKLLKRDVDYETQLLQAIDDTLDEELSDEARAEAEADREYILNQRKEDKLAYTTYKEEQNNLEKIEQAKDLENFSLEKLVKAYNFAKKEGENTKEAKLRIGTYLNNLGTERLSKIDPEVSKRTNTKNLNYIEKWMKVLSNISEYFPALQELHKTFEEKYLEKTQESNKIKAEHEKLGKAVIKEKNKGLGKVSDLFSSDSAKYFEYLDDNGKLRTNTTGLSKAQKEYLEFVQNLVKHRNTIIDEDDNIVDNTLIRIDKGFWETFKSEGYKAAWLSLLPQESDNKINWKGALTSRFDKPYTGKSYSKDFYKAANIFIEDITHVKYMKDVVPIADGIELFYEQLGLKEGRNFDNVIGFIEEWKKAKIYQEAGKTAPLIDKPLKFLRGIVSTSVMGFNMDANLMNVVIGNVGTIVKDGIAPLKKGMQRFSAAPKKSLAILKYLDVVKTDYDSNPKTHAGQLFSNLAFFGLKLGEIQIQGAAFLGKLSTDEFNSFEFKDGKLVFKPSEKYPTEKEFNRKINKYKNEVTDVQGKYADKDRSNALNYEFMKALFQFKLFFPAFWKDKFGKEFINSYGETKRGTFNYTKKAWQELKDDWQKNGYAVGTWKNKQTMSNLKYAVILGGLYVWAHADDDDSDKRKKANSVDNALQNMLFVFDPQQAKYLVTSPIAAQAPVGKFIDALTAAYNGDEKKFKKNAKKLLPYNKILDVPDKIEQAVK